MPEASTLYSVLADVAAGRLTAERAASAIGGQPGLAFAEVDHARAARCGFPEVVLAQGKRVDEVAAIARRIADVAGRVLVTRATAEQAAAVVDAVPGAVWHERARIVHADRHPAPRVGRVAVVCAGTVDIDVAEEAAVTAEALGASVERIRDVGVAGLHRLLARADDLRAAHAIVAIAGMEGALPTVVAGLVAVPVIAVPVSSGYGAALGGLTALFGMLNSCASNVTVVNIDNGFGAGYTAALINRAAAGARGTP